MAEMLLEYKEKPGTCSDCGNSPVNHLGAYTMYTLDVWLGAFTSKLSGTSQTKTRRRNIFSRLFSKFEGVFFGLGIALGVMRTSRDHARARTYRSQVIWEEAQHRRIEVEQIVLFGQYTDFYRAKIFGTWMYFESIPIPPRLDLKATTVIDDKWELKRALEAAGIAVPRAASVASVEEALQAFASLGTSVVLKPRIGSRGRHTTVNVRTKEDVAHAFESAQKLCRYVVVEEYLPGNVCRATVINGTLAGFFEAEPPSIVGDGEHSLEDRVLEANRTKPARVQDIVLTAEHERFIKRHGYTKKSIIPNGERVVLSHRTGRLFGGKTRELIATVHPTLRLDLERAAVVLGTPLIGFDLIMENPEVDPTTQTWGIIEGNTLPFIDLHYLPLSGTPTNVAAAVWDLWEDPVQ